MYYNGSKKKKQPKRLCETIKLNKIKNSINSIEINSKKSLTFHLNATFLTA